MKNELGFTAVEVGVLLIIIGIIGLLGYVVSHFISKLW